MLGKSIPTKLEVTDSWRTDNKAIKILNTPKPNTYLMLPSSQVWKVTVPNKTKRKSQKVAICKTRMPINFNKLYACTSMTTNCYIGQTLGFVSKPQKQKPRASGLGSRFSEPAVCKWSASQGGRKPLLKYTTRGRDWHMGQSHLECLHRFKSRLASQSQFPAHGNPGRKQVMMAQALLSPMWEKQRWALGE